ncbi:MAG: class I SAM-dependent methyltransferase [Acidimicrobiales bacterium]
MDDAASQMRRFWDQRACENAAWYVDTSCDYDNPDMSAFFAAGRKIVAEAFVDAPVQPIRRALAVEIGPGLGRICAALAEHFDRVIGIDVSAEMVERAKALVPDARICFEVGNGTALRPLESGAADLVMTFTVLQHLPSPALIEGYLRDAARVLAPGGVLAAQWNNLPHPRLWRARAVWWRLRHRIGGPLKLDPRVERPFVGTRLPLAVVERTLEDGGMSIKATKGLGTLFAWVWAEKEPSPEITI